MCEVGGLIGRGIGRAGGEGGGGGGPKGMLALPPLKLLQVCLNHSYLVTSKVGE